MGRYPGITMAVLAAVAVLATGAVHAPLEAQTETVRLAGDRVAVWNLVGRVTVVSGSGPDVVVRVTRGGEDRARLRLETGEVAGREALRIIYPSDRVRYRDERFSGRTSVRVRSDGTFGRGGDEVLVSSARGGLEAWADLRIEVPPGRSLNVHQAVGSTDAQGVTGDLRVDTHSGSVDVEAIRGLVSIDTGSGSVSARDVTGTLEIDTGSGSVRVDGIRGERVVIDTGSGSVTGADLQADAVIVDTGSGTVDLGRVASADVRVDTGSGGVELDLLLDVDRLEVDTGSGSVRVYLPDSFGAHIVVDTGSGGIDLDFPVEVRSMKRDHVEGRIGNGDGVVRIDTGSGSVRLIRR